MKSDIQKAISNATSLQQIVLSFNNLCRSLRDHNERIGYVAGIIFSEGPEYVQQNIKTLQNYSDNIRKTSNFPIFSSVDMFYTNEFYNQIEETKLPYKQRREAFFQFYRDILTNTFITDIFMTPRWEKSQGATDEHETAKKQHLSIHYVEELKL